MKNSKIEEYESLLNEKEECEKTAVHINFEYIKLFGDLLVKEYELQIENIKYKKMISFCLKQVNNGKKIDKEKLDEYIDSVMCAYNLELQDLMNFNIAAHEEKDSLSDGELKRIKNIYRMIVHLIHPDLHPEIQNIEGIKDLWNKAVNAYKANDLKTLVKTYDHIIILLKKEDTSNIEDIDSKIKELKDEIEYIKTNEPYTYVSLIKNKEKSKSFKDGLKKNILVLEKQLVILKDKFKEFDIEHKQEA